MHLCNFVCTRACSLGVHGDAEEALGVLEAASAEAAPPLPKESHAGHARVPTERVCLIHSLTPFLFILVHIFCLSALL